MDQDIRGYAIKLLSNIEINTIYELVKIKLDDLRKYRGYGSATETHISNFLKSKGLHFEMTDEEIRLLCHEMMLRKHKGIGSFEQSLKATENRFLKLKK